MKINPTRSPRAFVALLPTLLLATPALAQEATPTAPPIVQSAPVPAPAPAPDPIVQTAPPAADPVATTTAVPPPVEPIVADTPAEPAAPVVRRATPRTAPIARTPAPAPRATAPVTPALAEAPAQVAAAPVAATPPAPAAQAPAPATPATAATTTTQTAQSNGAIWPWIVGGLIILAGLAALLLRRRRTDDVVYEEAYREEPALVEPTPVIVPVAAEPMLAPEPQFLRHVPIVAAAANDPVEAPAPVPAEDSHIADADQADVDALTDGNPPVANRPWLEFGMRPVRAGTTSDEALVEIELTVGNAGTVAADDVRISTFLFASEPADAAEFERLLLDHGSEGSAEPVSIAAGEGTRVDATLALPKQDLAALFKPVVVADARYRLPDGSEGRTFASFSIGMTQEDGELGAMENNRPSMHEDIEARLYGTPEHV